MMLPIVVTLVGILILVNGQPVYWKLAILVVSAGMFNVVETVIVYRFIPATVYVVSNGDDDDDDDDDDYDDYDDDDDDINNDTNLGRVAGSLSALVLLLSMMMVPLVQNY